MTRNLRTMWQGCVAKWTQGQDWTWDAAMAFMYHSGEAADYRLAGYDANPRTETLSAMLLPEGDTPCGVADLTEDLEVDGMFDMVVCKDVLPYIPQELEPVALCNLAKLSVSFIILSWNVPEELSMLPHRQVAEKDILDILAKEHFMQEKYMTANLRIIMNRKDCCVLIKH